MKVVFISNFYNHHQHELSQSLYKVLHKNYFFISTEKLSEERRKLGYQENNKEPYLCYSYLNESGYRYCQKVIDEADVLIIGSAPEKMIRKHIKSGKLAFRYSERPLKKGREPLKYLPRLLLWNYRNPMNKNIYLLAASAYAKTDYQKFGLFRNRAYKWGYFPETKYYQRIENVIDSKTKTNILWVGRLIEWKHPEDALHLAQKLKQKKYSFSLDFIGNGNMEDDLKRMTNEYDLNDCVRFLGAMSPEHVRWHMEKAGIFLFTSDEREGWGAVLNEAMNSGCAIVASEEAGAVPMLLNSEVNGLVYNRRSENALYNYVEYLINNPVEQKRLGKAAYETITGEWNAHIAAERFVQLAEKLIKENKAVDLYESGPCSKV